MQVTVEFPPAATGTLEDEHVAVRPTAGEMETERATVPEKPLRLPTTIVVVTEPGVLAVSRLGNAAIEKSEA